MVEECDAGFACDDPAELRLGDETTTQQHPLVELARTEHDRDLMDAA